MYCFPKIIIFFSLIFLNQAFINISPKTEIDLNKSMSFTPDIIIDNLLSSDFKIEKHNEKDNYILLNQTDRSDIAIKIYASSQLSPVHGIFIIIDISESNLVSSSNNLSLLNILNEKSLKILQSSFNILPCSNDDKFLKNGFICNDNYQVTYTIYNDNFDGIRQMLGIKNRLELVISILPQ